MKKEKKGCFREAFNFCLPIVIAIVIALLLKAFVFANAVIPTGSMLNTIQLGDKVIASRLAYKSDNPERYDIVLFYYPDDPTDKTIFVKRVIGLPNETIEIVDGVVYVTKENGETIQLEDDFVTMEKPIGDFGPYTVPSDSYFMLGDNRNQSKDSRFWDNTSVHKDKIIGKVMFKYYPKISKIE